MGYKHTYFIFNTKYSELIFNILKKMHRDPYICMTVRSRRDGRQINSELPWPNSQTLKANFVVNIGILLKKSKIGFIQIKAFLW